MEGALIPIVVFLLVYVAISFELVNKAVAALLGVMILLVLHVIDEHTAVEFIDFETIMLLLGMMTIVAILRKSGFFTIVSVKIAELTKGSPLKILFLFSIVTAILSAFLDNVTTVLIVIPIVIELTAGMGLDPKIYVISQGDHFQYRRNRHVDRRPAQYHHWLQSGSELQSVYCQPGLTGYHLPCCGTYLYQADKQRKVQADRHQLDQAVFRLAAARKNSFQLSGHSD